MTAAGVQNLDSASYVPPPTSASTSDAKQSNEPQAAGAAGQPSDFRSELAQQTGKQETAPAGQAGSTQARSTQTGSTQKGSAKTGSGKPEKKKDARTDDANPPVVMPVQVVEPENQILPFSLALAQPQENAKLDQSAQPGDKATPDETVQGAAQQPAELPPSVTMAVPLPELQQPAEPMQPAAPKPSGKLRQAVRSADAQGPSATPDSSKVQVLPLTSSVSSAPPPPVVPEARTKSGDSSSQNPTTASAKSGSSQGNQPVSLAGFKLPASPAEPAASGVQETANSAPSSPSAMAFAARISSSQQTAQQKADQPVAIASAQSSTISGSQTPDQIPMRHAATAQIIQSASLGKQLGTEQDELKKDAGLSIDKFARPDTRTDMVLPRFEASSEPAPGSASQAPQQAAPAARPEPIIEPPAAPPTTQHDIRVRVPDNNGGSTQVRFVESGGEVRVSVRTADDGLAQNLRTHLNDLTQRLSDGGMPSEIWKPVSNSSSSQNDQQPSHQDGRGSGGQGSGGQSGQQGRQQQRPAWLEEMEASLHGEQN